MNIDRSLDDLIRSREGPPPVPPVSAVAPRPPPGPGPGGRRQIVVRDPKTGSTRIVGGFRAGFKSGAFQGGVQRGGFQGGGYQGGGFQGGGFQSGGYHQGGGYQSGGYQGGGYQGNGYQGGGYQGGGEHGGGFQGGGFQGGGFGAPGPFDAPITRIVEGYRGKKIVVRDPMMRRGALSVRGGVRKAYFGRRDLRERSPGGRSPLAFRERSPVREEREVERDIGGKVYVDNLSFDVTTAGLADIFGTVGPVKELRLLYDREGRQNGSADIVFQRRADAEEAVRSLNEVPLNGMNMRLSIGRAD